MFGGDDEEVKHLGDCREFGCCCPHIWNIECFFSIENVGIVARSFEPHERNVKLEGYKQMIIVILVFDRALFLLDYVELLKLL
jgi:hypothetical protein